jgi:hypothetical protein
MLPHKATWLRVKVWTCSKDSRYQAHKGSNAYRLRCYSGTESGKSKMGRGEKCTQVDHARVYPAHSRFKKSGSRSGV